MNLYLLADKLIDPLTANLSIDKLRKLWKVQEMRLGSSMVKYVYNVTPRGSLLRKVRQRTCNRATLWSGTCTALQQLGVFCASSSETGICTPFPRRGPKNFARMHTLTSS
jgi:hypothetical protein